MAAPVCVVRLSGSGRRGWADGPAAVAEFDQPVGVLALESGQVLVADTFNHRIRLVEPDGHCRTLAGSGAKGCADGAAGEASFHNPGALATDGHSQVLVADTCSHALRRVELRSGRVTTLAGDDSEGYCEGPPGRFRFPEGCALLGEDVVVMDTDNDAVRRVRPAGGPVERMDRSGERLDKPEGVLTMPDGRLLVSDTMGHRIVRLCPRTGHVSHVAGSSDGRKGLRDGSADRALFRGPRGLALSRVTGQVFVADTDNGLIRVLERDQRGELTVRTIETDCELAGPFSVSVTREGDLVTAEFDRHRIVLLKSRLYALKVALLLRSELAVQFPLELKRTLQRTRMM